MNMRETKFSVIFSASIIFAAAISAFAQGKAFSDPNVDYSFDIPDAKWKMTVKPSATVPNVEFVNVERNDGHLEVRKLKAAKGFVMSDLIRSEEQKLQFQQGYVAGKEENFSGLLRGTAFNFEFARSGRPMSGRFYFLKAGDETVYVLRFTGYRDKLRSLQNQTDSIARTFVVKRGS